jgi:MFS family permease
MRRAGRLRELLFSGVIDSFGMALGWTVVVLLANVRGGLAEAALYNAAMLGGVVLSAPVTGWLSRRFNGRVLLRGAASVEFVLRFLVLWGLVSGLPPGVVATAIVLMHVAAWAGFAGMRAEVSAVDASPRSMTRYAVCIAGVEAGGTALAALLPTGSGGYPTGWLLYAVFIVYLGSLLPTMFTARRARIATGRTMLTVGSATSAAPYPLPVLRPTRSMRKNRPSGRGKHARPGEAEGWKLPAPRLLLAGGGIMLIAAGPTLLSVPVTAELHGDAWVAGSAVAFSIGCLLSTSAVAFVGKLAIPDVLRWSLWGLGMLAGWILAPLYAPMVLLAQFAAGLCQTAFEGDMDARVAAEAEPDAVTRHLAYSAAIRALGGAIAVRCLPLLVTASAIGLVSSVAALILGVTSLIIWAGLSTAPHLFRRLAH